MAKYKSTNTSSKDIVNLHFRGSKNPDCQNKYISLHYTINGVQKRESINLVLYYPENTPLIKQQNQETLRLANAIRAKKVLELKNNENGFKSNVKAQIKFVDYLEQLSQEYLKRGSKAFAQTVHNVIKTIQNIRPTIKLNQVDKDFLREVLDYLNCDVNKYGRFFTERTKDTYFTVISIALNRAVKDDLIASNPAHKIGSNERPKAKGTTRTYLTIDEVRQMASIDAMSIMKPTKNQSAPVDYNIIKNAFLFACFCGLRYSDICKLTWGQIKQLPNNQYQVETIQQKTKEAFYAPLSANALKWLPERGEAQANDIVFNMPHISTVKDFIDRWVAKANIEKHVTFHVSRHTFATSLCSHGADIYTVSKLLGHTSVKTTQIYAKILDETKRKALDLIPTI